jgi:hypothetical protein
MTKKKTKKIERDLPNSDTLGINLKQIHERDYDGCKSIGDLLRKPDKYKEEE